MSHFHQLPHQHGKRAGAEIIAWLMRTSLETALTAGLEHDRIDLAMAANTAHIGFRKKTDANDWRHPC
jgi:hypothetical protein